MSRTAEDRLTDISEAAGAARKAVLAMERAEARGSEEDAQLAFDALLYRLLVIGEAVKALPTDLLASQPGVPWKEIARLRDLLAHHYYRVDAQVIRRTVEAPLDQLRATVAQLVAAEQAPRLADDEASPEDGRSAGEGRA